MLSHQTALAQELKQKIRDEDLTKNATQCSINQQIFPLIPERFLSELPKPPLTHDVRPPLEVDSAVQGGEGIER
jgi:hypothetical protein